MKVSDIVKAVGAAIGAAGLETPADLEARVRHFVQSPSASDDDYYRLWQQKELAEGRRPADFAGLSAEQKSTERLIKSISTSLAGAMDPDALRSEQASMAAAQVRASANPSAEQARSASGEDAGRDAGPASTPSQDAQAAGRDIAHGDAKASAAGAMARPEPAPSGAGVTTPRPGMRTTETRR